MIALIVYSAYILLGLVSAVLYLILFIKAERHPIDKEDFAVFSGVSLLGGVIWPIIWLIIAAVHAWNKAWTVLEPKVNESKRSSRPQGRGFYD